MSKQLSHDDIELLLGAYALDAVDRDEADAVELHLRECPRCQEEVREFRETAAMLAHSGAPAPDGVWDTIVAQLETRPPELTLSARRRQRRWPMITSAAASIAVLAASVAWLVSNQTNDRSTVASDPIDAAIIAAYADPDARTVQLKSGDGVRRVDAVILPNGTGFLVRGNLPTLGDDRTYQLWGDVGGRTVSLGVLGPGANKVAFAARSRQLALLAITDEVAGGVVVSQRTPVVVGAVEA